MRNKRKVKATSKPRQLNVQHLETRELFAALSFSSGVLQINMAQGSTWASVIERSGMLYFNNSPARNVSGVAGGQLPTNQIRQIVVQGTDRAEVIDLSRTNPSAFPRLTGATIHGRGERDTIKGSFANDLIYGGSGNDHIHGMAGIDRIYGEAGNDKIYGDGNSGVSTDAGATDYLYGGDGNDELFGGGGDDWLYGGLGDDILFGGHGNDNMYGQGGGDIYSGDLGFDVAWVDNDDYRKNRNFSGVESVRRG